MASELQKTCFVIMGFGIKTDYRTGRNLDLDKTYFNIIKPVFEELGYLCFRADEIKHAGMIDIPMYENILKSDFVVADISTLNPNAIYELGVRHAVKNRATIIIADKELTMPFDLNHIVISTYEHMGKDIGYSEVQRFKAYLKDQVQKLQNSSEPDSPLYTLFPEYSGPVFTKAEIKEIQKSAQNDTSLSDLLKQAESAKDNEDFIGAIKILNALKEHWPCNEFIIQQLALNTYKSKQPDAKTALENARDILKDLKPQITTNPETLALQGAIFKRLYDLTADPDHLRESLWSYERGFYIKQDYYNGINTAFLHTLNATKEPDKMKAMASYAQGISVRYHVIRICNAIMADKTQFQQRDDQQWIHFTLAEAHMGIGDEEKEKEHFYAGKALASNFDLHSYLGQKEKLTDYIKIYQQKYPA